MPVHPPPQSASSFQHILHPVDLSIRLRVVKGALAFNAAQRKLARVAADVCVPDVRLETHGCR